MEYHQNQIIWLPDSPLKSFTTLLKISSETALSGRRSPLLVVSQRRASTGKIGPHANTCNNMKLNEFHSFNTFNSFFFVLSLRSLYMNLKNTNFLVHKRIPAKNILAKHFRAYIISLYSTVCLNMNNATNSFNVTQDSCQNIYIVCKIVWK